MEQIKAICIHCGYEFYPRVKSPKKCGECQKPWPLQQTNLVQKPQQHSKNNTTVKKGITSINSGTVTSPNGYWVGATFAGMKTYREDKLDLAILLSGKPCTTAGVFTTNKLKSHSVALTQERMVLGQARAVIVNSGIANACVGYHGYNDAKSMSAKAASHLGLNPNEVLVCSTGIIGVELPMSLINSGIDRIEMKDDGGSLMARAIVTTDTRIKEIAVSFDLDGVKTTIGGVAKGSGMIHPNMATMLAFISTDATIESTMLQSMLEESVNLSFNMITVDGDTSTNDTVLLFANGASGTNTIKENTKEYALFKKALTQVCTYLAKEIVRDGEGATKVIEITIDGATSISDARKAARSIAGSSLVKTAIYGNDPNWGRIVSAIGYSGAAVVESKIALYINGVCLMEEGIPVPFHRDSIIAIMSEPEISLKVNLNLGNSQATAWGCDMTEAYVTLNSAYTT
ncbi:bifunctional glutamate N-acetyltransferase/amino-acid acetyltransferase ArgJ [SAR202 cluster bacterium AC-409-J13_OGT_754m]|nr:bifunctional glutamate N-acetyltransferase/amino-acid acetyltransferase ArgJ [SAR202 cluster bacterium AC-409-J13_OGT_754m]